ncbi:hypothetical protein PG991_003103 [Apiospora marii]|uniref:Uncharacterized protein n=1 Tax=Apiospora marii TaxID=335849 RepID=A0ABR1SH92_9PEZI
MSAEQTTKHEAIEGGQHEDGLSTKVMTKTTSDTSEETPAHAAPPPLNDNAGITLGDDVDNDAIIQALLNLPVYGGYWDPRPFSLTEPLDTRGNPIPLDIESVLANVEMIMEGFEQDENYQGELQLANPTEAEEQELHNAIVALLMANRRLQATQAGVCRRIRDTND